MIKEGAVLEQSEKVAERIAEVEFRVAELRGKDYTDKEIMESMHVDEGYSKDEIGNAMKYWDKETATEIADMELKLGNMSKKNLRPVKPR